MNQKTRWFVLLIAGLGLTQLAVSSASWQQFHGLPFLLCAVAAALCSYVGANRTLFQGDGDNRSNGFSLSLPFVLLSMVQLSLAEAVLVGCLATLVQTLKSGVSPTNRNGLFRIAVAVEVQASVISSAVFALNSLLPRSPITAADGLVVRILAGAGALFVANTLPVAVAVRLEGTQRLGKIWRESFWVFPYYLVSGAVALALHQGPSGISPQTALFLAPSLWLAYRYYRTQRAELKLEIRHASQMAALHLRAIEGLALAVEAKDSLNTRGHLRRVQVYALGIGKAMGLKGAELEALHAGALLHDIGKLAVPEHILTKPGKLTPEEFAKMKVHPLVGAEIVEQVQFPYPVAPIVRAHHEKWDGSGYPMGLKGEEIPMGARILSVVDCLDALLSDREYRKGMLLSEAMEYISAQSDKHFDPKVVRALQRHHLELDLQANTDPRPDHALSTKVIVEKGNSPGAGLERSTGRSSAAPSDFLASIAAARREEDMVRDLLGNTAALDIHQMLPRLGELVTSMVPCDALAFFIREANNLRAEFASGVNQTALAQLDVAVGEGLTGWVARNRQAVVNGNPTVDPGFWCEVPGSLNSALSVPLDGERGLMGVLNLYRRDRDTFTRDDLRILNAIMPQAALALNNSIRYREVQRMAKIDPVTGMANADLFLEGVEDLLVAGRRAGQSLTVLVLEMTQYQEVLTKSGKPKTDEVLAGLAQQLQNTCRQQDLVARLGPATFGLAFAGMDKPALTTKLTRMEQFALGNRALFGDLTQFCYGGASFPEDADAARMLVMIARRRAQPASPDWAESIRSLADSVGGAVTQSVAERPPVL